MAFELAIYFANVKRLRQMDEALRYVNLDRLSPLLAAPVFVVQNCLVDYTGNLSSLSKMNILFDRGMDFSRLYFGQEFCQNLIPPPAEIEESYFFARQMGWEYTYVTGGYLTDEGLARVRRNLDKLVELEAQCEVVFNDWGTLRILQREYPGRFELVMGRLLNKQSRLYLFAEGGEEMPILYEDIETPIETIYKNQLRAFADVSLSNPEFLNRLKGCGIKHVDMDVVPQGILRPEDGWGMNMGYYYPWGYMSTGRNCPTAGTKEPMRTFQMTDKPCGCPCQKYNCTALEIGGRNAMMIQRGPAVFKFHTVYSDFLFEEDTRPFERFIYEPYIPI